MTQQFPLREAYLCADCDCVSDASDICPCGSRALLSLAKVLNRPVVVRHLRPLERSTWQPGRRKESL